MRQRSMILPCYAADTAGVCSALYELGGMCAVHDASGINSTYATHDEPRWYDSRSMIYITALTETDAILGDDEKMVDDVCRAAADQHPAFIALCGSPMPMMIGTDYDAAAEEIERRTGIPAMAMHTNSMGSYLAGESEALLKLTKRFVQPAEKRQNTVNLIGATPLDLELRETVPDIRGWLESAGFRAGACMAMGDTLTHIAETAAAASVSLVLSYGGLAAAAYLYETYGIPYVTGVPVGARFPDVLAAALRRAAETGEPQFPSAVRTAGDTVVIGESVTAGSVAAECGGRMLCPLDTVPALVGTGDSTVFRESEIRAVLADMQPQHVIADPLYRYVIPAGAEHIEIPHFAFSGRCFQHRMRSLICKPLR